MNYNDYFHANYTSNGIGSYIKISIEIIGKGMFTVIMNKATKAVQCQKYLPSQIEGRLYCGMKQDCFMRGLSGVKAKWNMLPRESQDLLLECANCLSKSFRKFEAGSGVLFTSEEQNEVFRHIRAIRGFILDLHDGKNPEVPEKTNTLEKKSVNTDEWTDVQISTLSAQDLSKIIEKVSEEGNPEFGVEYNGRKYKIVKDEHNGMTLKAKSEVTYTDIYHDEHATVCDKSIKVVPKEEYAPPRKKTKKVQMRDNSNLTEFINGCYYKLVREVDTNFIKILNDKGEERTISRERLAIVEVYDEPPRQG